MTVKELREALEDYPDDMEVKLPDSGDFNYGPYDLEQVIEVTSTARLKTDRKLVYLLLH